MKNYWSKFTGKTDNTIVKNTHDVSLDRLAVNPSNISRNNSDSVMQLYSAEQEVESFMYLDTSISETKPDNSGAKLKSEITCKSQDRGKNNNLGTEENVYNFD